MPCHWNQSKTIILYSFIIIIKISKPSLFILQVGDTEEGNAVASAFCKDRNSPLLIASTRTNTGHSEAVAGLLSLVKIIFSMETGLIPPCLNFQSPSPHIEALHDGRMKVNTILF